MTRINLIPVEELTDQHLLSEHREIKRIPNLIRSWKFTDKWTPLEYKLWIWHVKFFYRRLYFLHKRYLDLYKECIKRWFKILNYEKSFDLPLAFFDRYNDFFPTQEEILISRKKILEKIEKMKKKKPNFYKYYWKQL